MRKPKELRAATESLSVVESDPLPTTTHTKGLFELVASPPLEYETGELHDSARATGL